MKQSLYFSHDYNARGDENIVRMRMALGWEGYGIYWAIVEQMYEHEGAIAQDYKTLAFYLQTEEEKVKKVVEDFGLFSVDKGTIKSDSITRRILERTYKSDMAHLNGKRRAWSAVAQRSLSDGSAINKENKGKEINIYSQEFELLWKRYPRKIGKGAAYSEFVKKSPPMDECLKAISWQVVSDQWTKDEGKYIPHLRTWISQRRWEDEQPATQVKAKPQYYEVCPGDPGFPGGNK